MALVVTHYKTLDQVAGRERTTFGSLAMDSAYPSNGEIFSARQFGLWKLISLHVSPSEGYLFEIDYTTLKLKAFWGTMARSLRGP